MPSGRLTHAPCQEDVPDGQLLAGGEHVGEVLEPVKDKAWWGMGGWGGGREGGTRKRVVNKGVCKLEIGKDSG